MNLNISGKYDDILVRPLALQDIEKLRIWRNNKANSKYLKQIGYITPESQRSWYDKYTIDPEIYTFAIDEIHKQEFLGTLSFYNFRNQIVEYGKILIGNKSARGKGYARKASIICLHIIFDRLGFNMVDALVHKDNTPALKTYFHLGFEINSELSMQDDEYVIKLTKEKFRVTNKESIPEIVVKNYNGGY
ncbi:MAG: GNAT family N-acetyltransferase [Clostridiales bacterium]